jgi:hypothetical protein
MLTYHTVSITKTIPDMFYKGQPMDQINSVTHILGVVLIPKCQDIVKELK